MTKAIQTMLFQSIIGLAAFALLFAFVALPLTQTISQNKRTLDKKSQEYNALSEKYDTLKRTQENAAQTEAISNKVAGLWPDDKAVSNFIVSLDDLAILENLTFDNVSVVESAKANTKDKGPKVSSVQFSLNTSGSFGIILDTLKKLEKFDRFNKITSVDLATKNDGMVSAKVNGEIYYGK